MDLRKKPRRYSKFRMILYQGISSFFSGSPISLERVEVRTQEYGKTKGVEPLKIVQLSDFHAGPFLNAAVLAPIIKIVNGLKPHVLALTGDYITKGPGDLDLILDPLSRLHAPLGRFAVFGNHDYRERMERYMANRFAEIGIKTLRNWASPVFFKGRRYWFMGIEDIEEGKYPDLEGAKSRVNKPGKRILLSHNPDVVKTLGPLDADAVLSGHTHGGQIGYLGLRRLFGGYHGEFSQGHYVHNGIDLYVNRGLGCLVVPFRFGSPPEVTLHHFYT